MNDNNHLTSSSSSTTAVGFSLLPLELLFEIFFRLALPELLRVRSVSKSLHSLLSDHDFRRLYHLRSGQGSGGWLFVYKKRPPRCSLLRAFNVRCGRWFQIPIADILIPALPPGEDLYFLAVSGSFFLFASNGRRELVAVNLTTRRIRRLPPSPLGPRGTSSWRRSGLKLVADPTGADRFRFLFAELYRNQPVLFEYRSETDTWHVYDATPADEGDGKDADGGGRICLDVVHYGSESLVLSWEGISDGPLTHRPRFPAGLASGPLVGFTTSDRFHVYGDGYLAVVWSRAVDEGAARVRTRVVTGVELMAMRRRGQREWEWGMVSRAPLEVVEEAAKPYGVMMGCLVEREGVVRVVLMSNCKGSWDIVWLSYERATGRWAWVPVPDSGTKGLNMAGLAVSSTFSRLWPASAQNSSR